MSSQILFQESLETDKHVAGSKMTFYFQAVCIFY